MSKYLILTALIALVVGAGRQETGGIKPVYGTTNLTPKQIARAKVKRYASVIELRPEKEQYYRKLHADVWPGVVAAIKKAKIRNYSIFVATVNGKKYLFGYLEYVGDNPDRDLATLSDDATTRDKWWPLTDPCQLRLPGTPKGEQWLSMEMLMHID